MKRKTDFVQKGIGAAICFEVGNHYDNLTFVPMKPILHSGCVLIWRKNEALSETVKNSWMYSPKIKQKYKLNANEKMVYKATNVRHGSPSRTW